MRWLILETSSRVGQVALAEGECLLGLRTLEEARRHARDLAPAVRDLLASLNWTVRNLDGVIVSRGPGSYTGLRVGLMSAKTLAYAAGCALLAVDTFAAIAYQAPAEAAQIEVIADAQQDRVYAQRFERSKTTGPIVAISPLVIQPLSDWLEGLREGVWVSGPALGDLENRLPAGQPCVAAELREPRPESLLAIGLQRYRQGERDDFWTLEPLYLRPSAAEEKWLKKDQ